MRQLTQSKLGAGLAFALALTSAAAGWAQGQKAVGRTSQANQRFDGSWWLGASAGIRAGFINGAADCLTWTANKKGFNATPEQVVDKITSFYKENVDSTGLSVCEAWERTQRDSPKQAPSTQRGETWNNPPWYLDGFWWLGETPEEKLGFVEGYLSCIRKHVSNQPESYSRPADFYVDKIDAFAMANANSKAGRESVASILHRYSDGKGNKTPK